LGGSNIEMGLKFLFDILSKNSETMTDERFNHLETQISELREFVRQSTNKTEAMQQDLNSMREDMTALRERVDSIEGTIAIEIHKGFSSLRNHLDDLSLEKSENSSHRFDEDLNRRKLERRIPAFDKRQDD
jgi:chromosome segregation ATPase